MEFEEIHFESTHLAFNRARAETHGDAINAVVLDTFDTLHPWMVWANEKPTVSDTISGLRRVTDNLKNHLFVISPKEKKDTIIGCIDLRLDEETNAYEIGYWLHKGYHNKGLCTESVKRVLKFANDRLMATHFVLLCRSVNIASKRVAQKCGFQLVRENGEIMNPLRPDWGLVIYMVLELKMESMN